MHPRDRAQLSSTPFNVVVEANMARKDRKIREIPRVPHKSAISKLMMYDIESPGGQREAGQGP